MKRAVVFGFVLLALASKPAAAQEVQVSPGDSLVVVVRGHLSLGGRFQVNAMGELILPTGVVVHVSGLMPSVVAARVREGYSPTHGSVRVVVTRLPYDGRALLQQAPPPPHVPQATTARAGEEQPPVTEAPTEATIAPGDVLEVRVPGHPELGGRIQVNTRGELELPGGARVLAAGSVPSLIAGRIRQVYQSHFGDVRVAVRRLALAELSVPEQAATPEVRDEVAEQISLPAVAWKVGLAAIGGVASASSLDHGYGGFLATARRGRLGIMGLGEYGTGGGYDSVLLSGGLTYDVIRIGGFSVSGTGGYGYYSENGDSGIERSIPATMAGGIAAVQLGPVKPALIVTGHFGRYDGKDVTEAISVNFLRVSFGIGF